MIELKIRPEYSEIYDINFESLPMPVKDESIREYVLRSGLGKEENILPVVNKKAKAWDYRFSDGDVLEIHLMAASG